MLEAMADAITQLLTLERFAFMVLGGIVGIAIGILPGMGGTVGMAVVLPFIYGMDTVSGVALLIGMTAVIHTADLFPSVLIGVPGSSGSQATIMDGYPLARRGEGARALGAGFGASLLGGLIGATALLGILTVARPLVLALGSPELLMLCLLGISMVGVLSQGSTVAGLAMGMLGLLIGAMGGAPATGEQRYTLDSLYLYSGIPLPVLALGLFAIPEMMELASQNKAIAEDTAVARGGLFQGLRDTLRHKWLVVRSALLGVIIGIFPGLGGSVVDWIIYGLAKQTVKNSQSFGTGDIRGVIAPESANNAKEGGTLVPTLLFGIPGSGTTAMLMGGLLLLGIQVGPTMVTDNLDVTLVMVWTLALANVVGAALCIGASGFVARLTTIPGRKLVPFLLVIIIVAAYQSTQHWGDLIALVVIGVVGWLMREVNWPRAPVLIGLVLSTPTERYLHLSMSRYELTWLTRPLVIILGTIAVALFVYGIVGNRRKKGQSIGEGAEDARGR